jgi:iron complex outermembrane receptor protein
MPIRTRRLAAGISCALLAGALGSPSGARAQDAALPAPASSTANAVELGKITVTAQNRTQEMQDVPIALSILTAKQVDTVAATDLSRMNLFVPGLMVDSTDPTQPTYRLRGIETNDFGIGTDSAVGVYVNGIYQTRAGGALMALNDIARVEVLKGPQGTLFGRNTAAGAISIVTNEPTDKLEGKVRLRYGEYGRRYGDALLNLPLNDDMALRVSVLDNQSNGWLRESTTGQHFGKDDEWGARAVWRWNITPDTRVLLAWDHDRLKQPSRIDYGLIPLSATDLHQRAPFPADPANYYNPLHAPYFNDARDNRETRKYDAGTLTIDHGFRWGSLTSTTNWTGYDMSHVEDGDGTNHVTTHLDTGVIGRGHTWYQEFKFSGSNDHADWVAGASYYRENADQTSLARVNTDTYDTLAINSGIGQQFTPDGTLFGYFDSVLTSFGLPFRLLGHPWAETVDNTGRYQASAVYGDVIWHLSDRLNLTTGLRYTRDSKDFTWYTPTRLAPELDATLDQMQAAGLFDLVPILTNGQLSGDQLRAILTRNQIFPAAVGQLVRKRNRWSDVSPRLVLDYKFTPDVMGYASLAKGYKAGGYNGTEPNSQFTPEHVWNLETGIKTVFPEQHLLLNASVYHYRYDDRQNLIVVPSTNGLGVPQYQVSNTNQKATGVELEVQWVPLANLHMAFNGSWIDSKYSDARVPAGLDDSGQPVFLDVSGQPVDEPRFSYSLSGGYTWHGIANGSLSFDANYGYRGKARCNDASVYQGKCALATNFDLDSARQRTDLRLDWNAASGRWGLGAYVNNLFDQRYVEGLGTVSQSVLGTPYAYITPPRMWGVEARLKF